MNGVKQAVSPAYFFSNNSTACCLMVDSICPLNGEARKGISPLITTADSSTCKVPDTLNPDILNLNTPVLSFQDSSNSFILSECWALS